MIGFLFLWWFVFMVVLQSIRILSNSQPLQLPNINKGHCLKENVSNSVIPSSPPLDTKPTLKEYQLKLYILIDQVSKGKEAKERQEVEDLIQLINTHLKRTTFYTFYFQLKLSQLQFQEQWFVNNDPFLYDTAQTWFKTPLWTSSLTHLHFVFSKYNTVQYRLNKNDTTKNDNEAPAFPMAWTALNSICKPYGSGLLAGYTFDTKETFAKLFMHELLHTFGCRHDPPPALPISSSSSSLTPNSHPSECTGYLMSEDMLSVKKWDYSPCTKQSMEELIHSATCIHPSSTASSSS